MKNILYITSVARYLCIFVLLLSLTSPPVFAASGSLDTTFGNGGAVFVNYGGNQNISGSYAVGVQPDGEIITAGFTYHNLGKPFVTGGYGRLSSNGSVNSVFSLNNPFIRAYSSLAIQPDGKILMTSNGPTFQIPTESDFLIDRYTESGGLDPTFNGSGVIRSQFEPGQNYIGEVAVQTDGKIVAAGGTNGKFGVARYNPNGTPDTSFDGDGKTLTSFPNSASVSALVIQADGKIVAAGGSNSDFALARYNADGSLDASFGTNGRISTPVGTANDYCNSLVLQRDGKIIAGGETQIGGFYKFALVRYNTDGSVDSSFGNNGIVTVAFGSANDRLLAMVIQPNNKFIAVGHTEISVDISDVALAKFNANGTPDISFGNNGKVQTDFQGNDQAYAAALQTDGKIVIAGFHFPTTFPRFALTARYINSLTSAASPAFDFDGDGRSDVSVYRSGVWHLLRSQAGYTGIAWGLATDKLAPADYDGDGKTDLAVYRASEGNWKIIRSSDNTFSSVLFGAPEDLPRPGDFDGDGRADISLFRPSNGVWYRLNSTNNQFVATLFGQTGDAPLVADFDGDGKSDIAVFRPSNGYWYRLNSTNNQFVAVAFGQTGDVPATGDFDGDAKADVTVFRPSNGYWYRLNSTNNQFSAIPFGQSGDVPTAADYDGDGRADVSVFRPSNGSWYRLNSTNNSFSAVPFGASGDSPVPAAYAP